MLNKTPEIGDTVVIRAVVLEVGNEMFKLKGSNDDCPFPWLHNDRITEVIPKPWGPKVGDTVWVRGYEWTWPEGTEILWCDREYALLNLDGGIPSLKSMKFLRKDFASCAV